MKLDLNGTWVVKNITDNSPSFNGFVPSTNYHDLLKNNLIPDPFYKTNEKDTLWIADKDWSYSKKFTVSKEILECERIDLVANCLDTIAEIFINGHLIANTYNAHVGYRFSIIEYLREGENNLEIIFRSPNMWAKEEAQRIGKNHIVSGLDKRIFIRKNQSHFGWDWGPEIPYSGITKDIYIDYGRNTRIMNFNVVQNHGDNYVNLDISFDVEGKLKEDDVVCYTIIITEPNGNEITKSGILSNRIKRSICIQNPVLWWTHELNPIEKQPLYKIKILLGTDGAIDTKEYKIGLRTITLDRSKDKYGSNFRFILNGVPIFAKGANWIPSDSLIDRVDRQKFEYYVNSAIQANMNMLRVWGGGFYEDEKFYDLCDEKGILVWQDFCFACRPYPFFDEKFITNVREEIAYNVKRLRIHPSLALWCGNNELEQMFNTWFWQTAFVKSNKKFFWEELETELRKYDTQTDYIPTSPVGVDFNKAVSCDNHGDNHLWIVWHGLQDVKYYRKRKTRFCSEFGFESLPDLKAIEQFADKEDYSINSKVFLSHQKCMLGNQKMEYYITSRFRLPKRFEDYVYLSQACQMECIKDATEFWRRNRDRCNGSLYWQLNDCWPVCSWSSVDYYGNYKALQYHAKHFFAPICVSMEGDKNGVKVYLLNDTLVNKNVTLVLKVVDFNEGVIDSITTSHKINALSNELIYDIPMKEIKAKYNICKTAFICELIENGKTINTKTLLFKYEKYLDLKKPNITIDANIKEDNVTIKIKSDKFARLVRLHNKISCKPFSDNWFDLLPDEEKEVTLPYYEGFSLDDIEVISCVDVTPKGSKAYDLFVKAKFILNPVNLAIYLGQPQSGFDYKG